MAGTSSRQLVGDADRLLRSNACNDNEERWAENLHGIAKSKRN